jgi:hypothetical protein
MAALGHQGKCTLCLHKKTKLKKLGDDNLVILSKTESKTRLATTLEVEK